jgi:sulfur-oxidizing protein SoxZ
MGKPIKIRAKVKGDVAEVKALMQHPMESGARINADTGEAVPKHYIQQVICKHNGNVVNTAYWGTGVSKTLTWHSNSMVRKRAINWKSAGWIIPVIPV